MPRVLSPGICSTFASVSSTPSRFAVFPGLPSPEKKKSSALASLGSLQNFPFTNTTRTHTYTHKGGGGGENNEVPAQIILKIICFISSVYVPPSLGSLMATQTSWRWPGSVAEAKEEAKAKRAKPIRNWITFMVIKSQDVPISNFNQVLWFENLVRKTRLFIEPSPWSSLCVQLLVLEASQDLFGP